MHTDSEFHDEDEILKLCRFVRTCGDEFCGFCGQLLSDKALENRDLHMCSTELISRIQSQMVYGVACLRRVDEDGVELGMTDDVIMEIMNTDYMQSVFGKFSLNCVVKSSN